MPLLPPIRPGTAARTALLLVAAARFARGARRAPAIGPVAQSDERPDVTVVIPARDEEDRIGPCLRSLAGEGVAVLGVDDGSTDGTAGVAAAAGATVVDAGPLPAGWAGKAHALQVGLEVATTSVVIALDADCRVTAGFVDAMTAALPGHILVSAALRVDAPDALGRAVHASMIATLLYRLGPPGVAARAPARAMANGQCMVFDRAAVLARGGFAPVRGSLVEDLALARHLAADGAPVAFLDGTAVAEVQGYGGPVATIRGWGRSLALREVTSCPWTVADLAVVWSTLALPIPRLLAGRGDAVDVASVALRLGAVAATAAAFRQRGPALLLAPLADPVVAVALTAGTVRPSTRWRGRDYG